MDRPMPPPPDLPADHAWGLLIIANEEGVPMQQSWARLDLSSGRIATEQYVSRTSFDFCCDTLAFRLWQDDEDLEVEEWTGQGWNEHHFCLDADLDAARAAWQAGMARRMGPVAPATKGPRL